MALGVVAIVAASPLVAQPAPPSQSPTSPAVPTGAVTRLVLDSIDLGAVTTLSELLQARVPGVVVQSGTGVAGAAPRVTARGRRTLLGGNDPLLVVDGVRTVHQRRTLSIDSTLAVSPLDDLPVEQIAVVEVLPGPAAAGRFGPGASNGAIVVTTRRATPGRPRVRGYAESGAASGSAQRTLWRGVGREADGTVITSCTRTLQAARGCTLERVEPWDPYGAVPWRAGPRGRLGASVVTGSERLAARASIDGAKVGGTLAGNDASRGIARIALDADPAKGWHVAIGALGALQRAEGAPGGLATYAPVNFGLPLDEGVITDASWRSRRVDANARVSWTPAPWLEAYATGGTSVAQHDDDFSRSVPAIDPTFADFTQHREGDGRDRVTTADVGLAGSWRPGARIHVRTTVGAQLLDQRRRESLVLRSPSLTGGELTSRYQRGWRADVRGAHLAQHLSLGPVALDGVVRTDRIEGLLAKESMVSGSGTLVWRAWSRGARSLDLRAGYGSSGTLVALDPFVELGPIIGGPIGGDRGLPEHELPFERLRETELGFDVVWGPALRASVTAYDQRASDLVLERTLTTTYGYFTITAPTGTRVRNRGVELALAARLVERPGFGASAGLRAWTSRSTTSPDVPPFAIPGGDGFYNAVRSDAPLGAYFGLRGFPSQSSADANGDGFVNSLELEAMMQRWQAEQIVTYQSYGAPEPTRALSADLQLRLGRRTTLSTVVEHRGGHVVTAGDLAARFRGQRAMYDPASSPDAQVDAMLARIQPEVTLQSGAMTRLREIALSYRLGGIAGARSTTLTLAGRNLLTLTEYEGLDPEGDVNASGAFSRASALGVPLPRTVALRLTAEW